MVSQVTFFLGPTLFFFFFFTQTLDQLQMMLQYTKSLKFEDEPDYNLLRNFLYTIATNNSITLHDNAFDWTLSKAILAKFSLLSPKPALEFPSNVEKRLKPPTVQKSAAIPAAAATITQHTEPKQAEPAAVAPVKMAGKKRDRCNLL